MRCPNCGLSHPPQFEYCVSCGTQLGQELSQQIKTAKSDYVVSEHDNLSRATMSPTNTLTEKASRSSTHHRHHSKIPVFTGLLLVVLVMLISAGATIFFLTKPADADRYFQQGQKQLANGQFAFAVKSLEHAVALNPHNPASFLALARAYIGIDQVDKAWQSISQAQQLGTGVVADPALASDLANYYRQHEQFEKAIDLLRPLAAANIAGKKTELSDLDAMWGDDALRNNNLDVALKCWEEVRDLGEGTRFSEVAARLATIYQKIANNAISKGDDAQALTYLNKLNMIADNASNHQAASEIYERLGQLDLSIDQVRKAIQLTGTTTNPLLQLRLAKLLAAKGKELLDAGDTTGSEAFMQQAQALDPSLGQINKSPNEASDQTKSSELAPTKTPEKLSTPTVKPNPTLIKETAHPQLPPPSPEPFDNDYHNIEKPNDNALKNMVH